MSHTTKSTVQCHLDSKKHQVAVETMQKREKARVTGLGTLWAWEGFRQPPLYSYGRLSYPLRGE